MVVFFVVALMVSVLVSRRVEALDRVEHQRRALLRSVSHDLRTPLATIRAVATDLRDGRADVRDHDRDELLDLGDRRGRNGSTASSRTC